MVSPRLVAASVAVWLALPVLAHAQQTPPPSPPSPSGDAGGDAEKPWAKGVSAEDQRTANELFKQGNALVRDSFFVQAVEKYQEAVAHWDHPAIHYNLAIALINLDKPLEVYQSLVKALAYGTQALDQEKIELAERYKKLVEQQLIWITVACDEPGAKVFVDGKELYTAPGSQEQLMRAGEHTFSASKDGFETAAVTRVFPGNDHEKLTLRLYRPEDLTGYKRKFASWVPWAVTGGGLAIAGVGALLHLGAAGQFRSFDDWAATCEADTHAACPVTPDAQSKLDTGNLEQTMAAVGYSIGAAAVVTGLTLVLINRPHPYRLDAEELSQQRGVAVVPVVTSGGAGVSASFHF